MKYEAYWISPHGEIVPVEDMALHHIDTVWKNPGFFGLSRERFRAIHEKHQERIGQEGKARQEIMVGLLSRGWIRIRYVPKGYHFKVQTRAMRRQRQRRFLQDWARKVTDGEIDSLNGWSYYLDISTSKADDSWVGSIHEFLGSRKVSSSPQCKIVHLNADTCN